MKRCMWNIFCTASLLVFVMSVAIWVRSCSIEDVVTHQSGTEFIELDENWKLFKTTTLPTPVLKVKSSLMGSDLVALPRSTADLFRLT